MMAIDLLIKQGVTLTGRNTTGPPRASSLVSYVAYAPRYRRQATTDDDRRYRPLLVCLLLYV